MVSTREHYFDTDHQFIDPGNQVAFAITAYDTNRNPLDMPEYGKLKAYYKSWGIINRD